MDVDGNEHDVKTNSSLRTEDNSHDAGKPVADTKPNTTTPDEPNGPNTAEIAFNPNDLWGSIFDNNF